MKSYEFFQVPCINPLNHLIIHDSLSLFAMTERVEGICLSGTKYELSGGSLEYSFPLGVSNSFRGDVSLSFDSGMMLVMCCMEG